MSFVRKPKVMYKCDRCSYITNRKSNLTNHLNRKVPCSEMIQEKDVQEQLHDDNRTLHNKSDTIVCQPCDDDSMTIKTTYVPNNTPSFMCTKCERVLSNKRSLDLHEAKCDGLHPLQCNVCLKMFASRYGKSQHKKSVKCVSVSLNDASTSSSSPPPTNTVINNNNNDYSTTTNIHNDNSITINLNFDTYNHDHVNVDKLKQECRALKSSLDCVVKYIQHTFYDPEHPDRRLVALSNLRPDYKFIDVFRNEKWEKDTQQSVISKILQKSLKLTTDILKSEDPDHFVEIDPEAEQTDNLKKYETNMTVDDNRYRKRASQKVKKEIYNKTTLSTTTHPPPDASSFT